MRGEPRHQGTDASQGSRSRPTPATVVVTSGLLAAGLCIWQLTLPGRLTGITEYDDGVYLGAAIRLVSGAMPYRDFVFVQPPGIVLLTSPVALLGRALGSVDALAMARIVTAVVTGLDAGLVAWLVRRRGRVAMAVAGGALATFPLAVTADHTLMLGPYVVLFVLAGSVVAFGEDVPSTGRLALAGALVGVGGAVKLWAVFPFVALCACQLPRVRARVLPLVAGAAAGFCVVCLPFAVLAPRAFVHEVLVDQLGRSASALNGTSLGARLAAIAGLGTARALPASPALTGALLAGLGALLLVSYGLDRSAWQKVDTYVVLATLVSVAGLLAAPAFYSHYAYFAAPMLAAVFAVAVSGTVAGLRSALGRRPGGPRRAHTVGTLALLCGAGLLAAVLAGDVSYDETFLPATVRYASGAILDPGATIARVIPPGACVVFDQPILTIEADRFSSSRPGCPQLVDPYGMWLADARGLSPPAPPPYAAAFVATWRSYLAAADYCVLSSPGSSYLPWDASLTRWFDAHYTLVLARRAACVYVHDRAGGGKSAAGPALTVDIVPAPDARTPSYWSSP